mmetsp:Transcript_29591/g.87546  ORF Transcript_29591/g.87546 Transcript_29591/m.87546 type:complete len:242 (-) Transcript_29591:1012-1737(-)
MTWLQQKQKEKSKSLCRPSRLWHRRHPKQVQPVQTNYVSRDCCRTKKRPLRLHRLPVHSWRSRQQRQSRKRIRVKQMRQRAQLPKRTRRRLRRGPPMQSLHSKRRSGWRHWLLQRQHGHRHGKTRLHQRLHCSKKLRTRQKQNASTCNARCCKNRISMSNVARERPSSRGRQQSLYRQRKRGGFSTRPMASSATCRGFSWLWLLSFWCSRFLPQSQACAPSTCWCPKQAKRATAYWLCCLP